MDIERKFFTKADCMHTDKAVEAFSIEEQKGRFETSASSIDEVKTTVLSTPNWLPIAAEQYNISPNIKDYILLPVTAIISDLPNRNAHSFSGKTLTSWVTDRCQVMAHTFTGVPVHKNHVNKDPSIAKGIVLSSILKPMEGTSGKLLKVVMLAAMDRTRDSVLANKFLTGEADSFSMGAYTQDYRTTCCGALASKGGCEHIQTPHSPKIALLDGNRLGYWSTVNPSGFELSALENSPPAYEYASKHSLINMGDE